jgi:ABC-2 type transport system ATP-binding protein
LFDGKQLHEYGQPSQVVGILLEAKAFHPTRSARHHLRVLAAAGNIPDQRVDEVLELVGLSEVAKKKPGKFSLGMSQRLGIAAAILGKPKYLLLDEPANGLDADEGNAVFVSSHLLSEMALMADNIVVIGKGKMIASTSVGELISGSSHSSVFVRTDNMTKLEKALKTAKLSFTKQDAGLTVLGTKTDAVGKLAHTAGVTVLELANHSASLEEAFLELTADAQEYKSHAATAKETTV